VDHIIPVADGGSHHISNLTTACRKCNQAKGTKRIEPTYASEPDKPDGFVGLFVHFMKDGWIQYQGRIIGREEDTYLVQFYSCFDGTPNIVKPYLASEIRKANLYANHEEWLAAFDREWELRMEIREARSAEARRRRTCQRSTE